MGNDARLLPGGGRARAVGNKQAMFILLIASVLVLGSLLAIQVAVNGRLRVRTGDPVHAALISSFVSVVSLFLYSAIVLRQPLPEIAHPRSAPWWLWTVGFMGAAYIVFSLVLVTRVGSAMFFALIVVGQKTMALVMDHFGLFGLTRHEISPLKILGASFLVAGVVLIRRF